TANPSPSPIGRGQGKRSAVLEGPSPRHPTLAIPLTIGSFACLVGGLGIWAFSHVKGAFQIAVTASLPAVDHLLQADRDMLQALVAERSLMFMSMATALSIFDFRVAMHQHPRFIR